MKKYPAGWQQQHKKKEGKSVAAVIRSDQIQRYISPFCRPLKKLYRISLHFFCVAVGLAHCVTDARVWGPLKKKLGEDCLAANYSERIRLHIF